MPLDPSQYSRLLEHQARCKEIQKQAYHQRYAELMALEKCAQLGVSPTREFQPGRAAIGGLAGAGLGAAAAPFLESPYARAAAVGIPALLGAGLGGFTTPSEEQLQYQMAALQMAKERQQLLGQYATQLANAETL